MQSIRCQCGKIVCQMANLPEPALVVDAPPLTESPACLILCRHCKRYLVLQFPSLTSVGLVSDMKQPG